MKKVSKRMGIVKKAQTGVQVPKEAENKEFTYLTSKERGSKMKANKAAAVKANDSLKAVAKAKKAKNGGSYASAGKAAGYKGEGLIKPTDKNVPKSRKQATFKSGGSMGKCKNGCM